MLILYPATLLKEFMISNSFLVEFLGSLQYRIMASASSDSVTSFFPVLIPFISCSYLIALFRNSKAVLNRSRERNSFSCSPFSMMLAIGMSYIVFIALGNIPSILHFFRVFIMKRCWILSKVFFCIYWEDHVVFVLASVHILHYVCGFMYVETSLYSWNETDLVVLHDSVLILRDAYSFQPLLFPCCLVLPIPCLLLCLLERVYSFMRLPVPL
jgi:hypothetical protein